MNQSSRRKWFLSLFSELPPVCQYLPKNSVPKAERIVSSRSPFLTTEWTNGSLFFFFFLVNTWIWQSISTIGKLKGGFAKPIWMWGGSWPSCPVLVGTDNTGLQEQQTALWYAIIICYFPGGGDGIVIFFFYWMMEHERHLTLFIDSVCSVNNSSQLQLMLTPE